MNKGFKRVVCFTLAVVICVGILPPINVQAAPAYEHHKVVTSANLTYDFKGLDLLNYSITSVKGLKFSKDGVTNTSSGRDGDWDVYEQTLNASSNTMAWSSSESSYIAFRTNLCGLYRVEPDGLGLDGVQWTLNVADTYNINSGGYNSSSKQTEVVDYLMTSCYDCDLGQMHNVYCYADASEWGSSKGSQVFIGCDFNTVDFYFYYYWIYAPAYRTVDDDLVVWVGRFNCLLYPHFYDRDNQDGAKDMGYTTDTGTGNSAVNARYCEDRDISDQIVKSFPNIADVVLKSGTIQKVVDNKKITDDDLLLLSIVDDLLDVDYKVVNPGTDDEDITEFKVVLRTKDYRNIQFYSDGNNQVNTKVNAITESEGSYINHSVNIDMMERDNLVFGNTRTPEIHPVEVTANSETDSYVCRIVADLITTLADLESDKLVDNIDEYVRLFEDAGLDFFAGTLKAYKKQIMRVVEESRFQDRFSNGESTVLEGVNSTEYYSIAERLFKYNIERISNGGDLAGEFCTDDGKLIKFSRSVSGVDDSNGDLISFVRVWNNLNDYQRAVLTTAYYGKLDTFPTSKSSDIANKRIMGIGSIGSFSVSDILSSDNASASQEVDWLRSDINKYDESTLTRTGSVTNIARICDIAARYTVISSVYSNSSDSAEGVYAIYHNGLESLVGHCWNYTDVSDNWFSYLPKNIGRFGPDSRNYTALLENRANWERFVAMLYNVDYAFEICAWAPLGKDNGYSPEEVRGWFDGSKSAPAEFEWLKSTAVLSNWDAAQLKSQSSSWSGVSIDLLRSIVELEKMCQWLDIGMDDWSEAIKAYRQLYSQYHEFFEALYNAGILYNLATQGEKSIEEPMGTFFSLSGQSMTDQWIKGFALSALYVPMETNVYDASSVLYVNDSDWVADFFYKYAFFRKALYINTDNSAMVNQFTSGERSGTRVATLSDLLNYDRDIILTVDDNFYNANQIDTIISRLDYTAIRNTSGAADTATGTQAVSNFISGLMDLDAGKILKTGADSYYSATLKSNVTQLGQNQEDAEGPESVYDQYLLSNDDILGENSVLDSYEYSVKMSYGVVSAVYRSDSLYNECLKAIVTDNAIFKSSKAICSTPGTNSSHWRSVYNYYMLANLEEQMKNDCASTLDLDAPIFVDIFGNILTESGLVIIPAACNATLCGSRWTPYTIGWSEYYNNGNHMNTKDFNEDVYEWLIGQKFSTINSGPQDWSEVNAVKKDNAGGYFWIKDGELVLRTSEITSGNLTGIVQWEVLNKNSTVVQSLFFNDAYFQKGELIYNHTLTNLVMEVLRGAPIEYIDYEYEGLSGNLNISKYGVYMAYKLEELVNTLVSGTNGNALGGNSVVTMPNLAFVKGVEYIMLYVFKIVFAVMIFALAIQLYLDATKNSLGVKSVLRFISTCMLSIIAFTLIPNLVSWTYYNANKSLLAEESGRLMMLNYVKEYDGSEIGITSVTTPETSTELYMKVSDVGVNWWQIIPDVLFGNTSSTVSELYRNSLKDNPMALTPGVQMKGDGLYVNVQDIYDSSDIQFTPATNTLEHYVRTGTYAKVTLRTQVSSTDANGNAVTSTINGQVVGVDSSGNQIVEQQVTIGSDNTSVVSYVSPYYVFLEQLVSNVNEYNISRDITAYSWSVGSNGHVLTYDVISPYLTSSEFLEEGFDILGLDNIIGLDSKRVIYNYAFTDSDKERMSRSSWYHDKKTSGEAIARDKIDKVYEYARDFVISNKDVLGKVPDEVFIKVMAMQCAIKYNKEFGCLHGTAIEIINVDTRDLMRFMVSKHSDMYKYYSYSFARYVYEKSGTIGVIFAALLLVVYWLTSFIKPLLMVVILALLIINVVFRKLLFNKESRCIEGYLIGCACLCMCNYAYAIMLKLSMSVANWGFGAVTALMVAFIVQVFYIIGLVGIMAIEIKDWKNSGFGEWQAIGATISSKMVHAKNIVADKVMSKSNTAYRDSAESRRYTGDDYNRDSVEAMIARDRERDERGSYSPN